MTLKQIHAMPEVGQEWSSVNTYNDKASGPRTLLQKGVTQFVWKTPQADRSWMPFPKASQIIEARDGFSHLLFNAEDEVKYRKPGSIAATLTLIRVCVYCREAMRHAYFDATTPGFFNDRCEKHRKPALSVPA